MSMEKIKQIRELVQKEDCGVDIGAAAKSLAEIVGADLYFLGKDGRILAGSAEAKGKEPELNPDFQQRMAFIFQPAVNLALDTSLFNDGKGADNTLITVYPMILSGNRLGNLLLTRKKARFNEDEQCLLEYAALAASVIVSGAGSERRDMEAQMKTTAQVALESLSYSELEAIRNVFAELGGDEGFLVASKVADRIGITRSVIVNAMRKLESAGVVESRSLGMKGTYIRVKNAYFLSELSNRKH